MKPARLTLVLFALTTPLIAREAPALPEALSIYQLTQAPEPGKLLLEKGDRLAICGDSITEQKQYSLIIEAYLAACVPDLEVTCRQYGWGGERADGFLNRMESDVLRFKPTVATTCYGMNDFRYVPFDESIAAEYRRNLLAIAEKFKNAGTKVLIGSPGIIDSVPHWVKSANGTQQDLNLSLSRFRNIALEAASASGVSFADIYRPMLHANHVAKERHGPEFKVAGKDGVHPAWAGQVVMAYGFLKGMGLDGDLGSVEWDAESGKAEGSGGHEVLSAEGGKIRVRSARFPFSPGPGDETKDDTIPAGLALVPFHAELNRFVLRVNQPSAPTYEVVWGGTTKRFTADQLREGVNLASEFADHPLVPAFRKVWDAAAAKQDYETRQIKMLVHGPEGQADLETTFALTEKVHERLASQLKSSFSPTEHTIEIRPASGP